MPDEVDTRIGVLGPLRGTRDGTEFMAPRGRAGVLLAVLAMSAGHPVSGARLAELIWPEEQPERIRASLHSLVARVRALLPGMIVTVGDSYVLGIDPDHVDLLRFRRLVRAADAAGDPATARQLLDQALGLWRGEPLSGLRSVALERDVLPGLIDERLSALQRRADLELAAGSKDWVIAELRGLTSQHPLREPLWGQLLRALAAAGRPAEAIQEYHRAREILAAELGVDPSSELQDLYRQLLQTEELPPVSRPPLPVPRQRPAVPRQLPARAAGFVGRAEPLRVLSGLADDALSDPDGVMISAVSGMAGVGKTALVLHWAHHHAAGFTDGQLYADLRGFDPSGAPALPSEILCEFLAALGVPAADIPAGLQARAALYRTVLSGRQVMIVLDNARDAGQVRPLLPGSAGCMVVVTSRSPLTSLATGHGARMISLDVLSSAEAVELLSARLSPTRVAADAGTAAELAELCGRLPLALAITAARAAARPPRSLPALVAELRDTRQRLDAFDGGDPASNVRTVFSWSCEQLSEPGADLFRLLGIHPGPDISMPAAASLAGTEPAAASAALRELTALNLVTEHRSGRYALPDLLRVYAAEQASAIPAGRRQAAICRVLDHYLHTGRNAVAPFPPQDYSITLGQPQDKTVVEVFEDSQQATEWFEAEYQVLLAVIALAASAGFDRHAWQIPATLARFLDGLGHWHAWAEVQSTALAAARRLRDQNAQAIALRASGALCLRLASYRQAREHFGQALRLYRQLDDPAGQATIHGSLAMTYATQGSYREALAHSERALRLSRSAGDPVLLATMLNKVGWHAAHLDDYQRALACCEQALRAYQDLGNRYSEAYVWNSLGYIHQRLADYAKSLDCYQHATALFREIGHRINLADTLISLGDASDTAGHPVAALDAWGEALTILSGLHHPDATQLDAKLRRHQDGTAANRQHLPASCTACTA